MKRKLALPLILALLCSAAPAQKITKTKESPAVAAFADSLANLRAAYYAYFRMWDDLDARPRVSTVIRLIINYLFRLLIIQHRWSKLSN